MLLAGAMALLAGCGGQKETLPGGETIDIAGDGAKDEFRVGYSRINITPMEPVPLAGYGNTRRRMSDGFLDYIYVTCTAITGTNNETVLFISNDLCTMRQNEFTEQIKNKIIELTGIPFENININFSHTHSSVDNAASLMDIGSVQRFTDTWMESINKVVMEALADREPCEKMLYGTADLTSFNFVKHYFTDLDESVGDNHGGYATGTVTRHTTESNHNMYLLKFERKTKEPVLLSNFRAHPIFTGGDSKTDISSDYIHPLRENLEKMLGCKFAYLQGESGNQNAYSRISSEDVYNRDYLLWGEKASEIIAKTVNENMQEVAMGPVYCTADRFDMKINHSEDGKLAIASQVYKYFTETNDRVGIWDMCYQNGFESPYHANSIITKHALGESLDVPVNAGVIGDFAFATAPFETFDTNGDYVRANAPTKYTFVLGYSNEAWGYLPSQAAYEYGCYEADTTRFAAGSGEAMASHQVDLLKSLWAVKEGK